MDLSYYRNYARSLISFILKIINDVFRTFLLVTGSLQTIPINYLATTEFRNFNDTFPMPHTRDACSKATGNCSPAIHGIYGVIGSPFETILTLVY